MNLSGTVEEFITVVGSVVDSVETDKVVDPVVEAIAEGGELMLN